MATTPKTDKKAPAKKKFAVTKEKVKELSEADLAKVAGGSGYDDEWDAAARDTKEATDSRCTRCEETIVC